MGLVASEESSSQRAELHDPPSPHLGWRLDGRGDIGNHFAFFSFEARRFATRARVDTLAIVGTSFAVQVSQPFDTAVLGGVLVRFDEDAARFI